MTKLQLALLTAILFNLFSGFNNCSAQAIYPRDTTVCIGQRVGFKGKLNIAPQTDVIITHQQSQQALSLKLQNDSTFSIGTFDLVGTYKISYIKDNDTVDLPDILTISNYPKVSIELSGNGSYCASSDTNIVKINFSGTAPYMMEYKRNGVKDTILSQTDIFYFNPNQNLIIDTIRVSDAYCTLDTVVHLDHKVILIPAPEITGSTSVCVDSDEEYAASEAGYSYNWSIPAEAILVEPSTFHAQKIILNWSSPGYSLIRLQLVNDDNNCSSVWANYNITVSDRPKAEAPLDTSTCFYSNEPLNISIPTKTGEKVYWPDGNITSSDASFTQGGNYTYLLINEYGCADTSMVAVLDSCTLSLFVPEAFTPNGDQINDRLELFGFYINLEFKVYSESGMLLFTMHQDDEFWDGTVDGKDVPNGTYFWNATFSDQQGKENTQNGHVVLIR